jgi:hypothetical protein
MTKTFRLSALALALASPALAAAGKSPAAATPFEEKTTVQGKVPIDLSGVWFVVAHARMAKDPTVQKFRTFPQLIQVVRQKDGTPVMHLLDVRLPKQMAATIKAQNDKLEPWTPSAEDLKLIARELPKMKPVPDQEKDVVAGDVAIAQVVFTLATPDRYAEVFPRQDEAMATTLADTAFTLEVVENYRGLPLPPGSNVAPLMQRNSIYGVRNAADNVLEGRQVLGFIAAGIGQPIPIGTAGEFRMYRIARASGKAVAPAKETAPTKAAGSASKGAAAGKPKAGH